MRQNCATSELSQLWKVRDLAEEAQKTKTPARCWRQVDSSVDRSSVQSHWKAGFGLLWLSLFIAALFPLQKDEIPSGSQREYAEDSGHELD
jgi:hypothetical protein